MITAAGEIFVTGRQIRGLFNNSEKSAAAVNLTYVNDAEPGIRRIKRRKKFIYVIGNKQLRDKDHLERIRRLIIPPAWEKVWICRSGNGHLQATGFDIKDRKQYKYHQLWSSIRNHTKFYRLQEFAKAIPDIRQQIEKDLSLKGLPLNKVLAVVVSLMERTSIRIGNNFYEKLYGSFGLTTLKDHHVKISGSSMRFMFRGKKGVSHQISLKSKRLATIVRQCRDIPGKELFQYIEENGERKCIDSGMVNAYLKEISGRDFTAKDFRTWTGTVQALVAFREIDEAETGNGKKKNIVLMLDSVAKYLGNTRSVCKKYYVHPLIIKLYENSRLQKYLAGTNKAEKGEKYAKGTGLAAEEKILLKILQKESLRIQV